MTTASTIHSTTPEALATAAHDATRFTVGVPWEQFELLNATALVAVEALKAGFPMIVLPDGLSITGGMSVRFSGDQRDIVLRISHILEFKDSIDLAPIAACAPEMSPFDELMNLVHEQRSMTISVATMPTGVMMAAIDCFPYKPAEEGRMQWFRIRLVIWGAEILATQ